MSQAMKTEKAAVLTIDTNRILPFTRDSLRGVSVTVLGRKGSGKSTTVAVFAEELLKQSVPMVIVDPQDEYYTLAQQFDILVAGRSSHARVHLDPEKAGLLAEFSLTHSFPVVLSLSKYDGPERFALLKGFFERLWEIEEDLKRPYFVLCEEAHTILPQVGTTPVFGILSTIFLQGRKNGLGTILSTQRSQKIHKDTITQSEIFVLHKVGHPRDIEVYEDLIPLPAKAVKAMIALLRKGSAIVKYEDDSLPEEVPNDVVVRVQIRPQETYHVGATPSFEEAAPISLRQIDETVLAELQRLLAATLPNETSLEAELRQRVASLEATNAQKDGTIGLLEEELGKRDEAIRELEKQVSLLSKLTVTITGLAFPELPAILPPSLTVDHARVGQVTIEDGPPLRESAALEEGARQVPPASDVQGILEAIAQHLAQVVQSDTELQRLQEKLSQHAQRLTAAPSEGVKASLDEASLTSAQQRKLKGLITRLQRLSRFQRCLLHLLIQREGEEASYREISERLRYELGTVQHESTTALQREGLIKRARSTLGYISCFADYCQKKYPGADARLVCEQILSQVTVQ